MATTRPWEIIEDLAVDRRDQDRFDHLSVARELSEIVRGSTQPMAIGLFGPFGTGKSGVVKLLTAELATNHDWAVLHVSAEHHSGTARVRGLLYALLDAAQRKNLINGETYRSEWACLEGSRQRTVPRTESDDPLPGRASRLRFLRAGAIGLSWIGAMLSAVWLLGVVLVAAGHLVGVFRHVASWAWFSAHPGPLSALLVSTAVIGALLGAGKDGAIQALKAYEITVTSPRPDSTDELEQVFSRLIGHVRQRLVIAIDDIDRLAANEVLDALSMIRSLLLAGTHRTHHPVFVLACDEDIVREAIVGVRPGLAHRPAGSGEPGGASGDELAAHKATEEAAQEYLNKLFTVRLTLPAHTDIDLRTYTEGRLLQPELHPVVDALGGITKTRTVLDTLIHRQVRDPRHAIRLLNTFLTDYRLAKRREQHDGQQPPRIAPGEVTGYPLALARLIVLRHDYRELYDRIQAEYELLDLLDDALLGSVEAMNDPLIADFLTEEDGARYLDTRRHPGLVYLRATAAYTRLARPAQLGALITLGSTPASRLLGSAIATAIHEELIQRQTDAFTTRLQDPEECARVLNAASHTLDSARKGQDLDNAAAAVAQALARVASLREHARTDPDGVGQALSTLTGRLMRRRAEMTVPIAPQDLVPLLDLADDIHTVELLTALRRIPSQEDEQVPWAKAILNLPPGPYADELAPAVEAYFDTLAESGSPRDLDAWLGTASGSTISDNWPPTAYGAMLAMAARHENTQAMQVASQLTGNKADEHQWQRPVLLGVLPGLSATFDIARLAVDLLALAPLPTDGWGPATVSDSTTPNTTLVAEMVEAACAFLVADDDEESSVATADLLHSWLPVLVGQISPAAKRLATTVIAEAIGKIAATYQGLAAATSRILPDLPDDDAANCATAVATALTPHRDPADGIGTALASALVEYLRRIDAATSEPQLSAAQSCLDILTTPIADDTVTGRFARSHLAAVLTTTRGQNLAIDLATRLISSVPNPGPTHTDELINSLNLLFLDKQVRDARLPQLLAQLQMRINVGQPQVPVTVAAIYAAEPAVTAPWFGWIAQYWGQVPEAARDKLLQAGARPELRQTTLPELLAQHLLATSNDAVWDGAFDLWPALNPDRQAQVLAAAHGRSPRLADYAAAASEDLLVNTLNQADDHLDDALKLIGSNPSASAAITTYVNEQLRDPAWHPDRVRAATAACPQPHQLWNIALDGAGTDQSTAQRAAVLINALISCAPDAIPADLAERLTPVLITADLDTVTALGTAVSSAPEQAKKLMRKLTVRDHRAERTAFKNAAGL